MADERRTILIVDDDPTVLETAQVLLEELGHEIVSTTHPEEALALLAQHRPNLLVMDVSMGCVDGLRLLREVRSHGELRSLPVLVWSGQTIGEDQLAPLGARLLEKPWHRAHLVQAVTELLGGVDSAAAGPTSRTS